MRLIPIFQRNNAGGVSFQNAVPEPKRSEPQPEFTDKSAAKALKESQEAEARLDSLQTEEQEAAAELERAQENFAAKCEGINDRRRQLNAARERGTRAERFLLRTATQESADEVKLRERGKELLAEATELKSRYGVYAATMTPPAETADVKELAELNREISELDKEIKRLNEKRPTRWLATSRAEYQRREAVRDREQVQIRVDRYERSYKHWLEIQAAKKQADENLAKANQLRQDREAAVTKKALAGVK